MARINYTNLIESYAERGVDEMNREIRERFAKKEVRATDFDFGALFESCFGWHEFKACRSDRSRLATQVMEAAGGVSTAAFSNISGQIVYATVLDAYQAEEFTLTKLIPERQSPFTFEKMAGVTEIGDKVATREEGEPYAIAGVGQTWIHGPETQSRGLIVPVTREAVFFDRTGQVVDRCRDVGKSMGFNTEKRAADCVIDENGGAKSAPLGGHRYYWRDTSIATYGDNSGTHSWDNLAASNALVDWTNLDAMDQLFNQMLDPDTAEPIVIKPIHLVVPKSLEKVAQRIQRATTIRVATPGFSTTGNPTQTEVTNPYSGAFEVVTSRYLYNRLATKTSYFYGDIGRAFFRAINFPLQTIQAPANSQAEFERDIVMQFRADERSNFGTMNPRMMVKSTVA
jgi:hypothetical protein